MDDETSPAAPPTQGPPVPTPAAPTLSHAPADNTLAARLKAAPPGTVAFIGDMPVDEDGQDMQAVADRKAKADARKKAKP